MALYIVLMPFIFVTTYIYFLFCCFHILYVLTYFYILHLRMYVFIEHTNIQKQYVDKINNFILVYYNIVCNTVIAGCH